MDYKCILVFILLRNFCILEVRSQYLKTHTTNRHESDGFDKSNTLSTDSKLKVKKRDSGDSQLGMDEMSDYLTTVHDLLPGLQDTADYFNGKFYYPFQSQSSNLKNRLETPYENHIGSLTGHEGGYRPEFNEKIKWNNLLGKESELQGMPSTDTASKINYDRRENSKLGFNAPEVSNSIGIWQEIKSEPKSDSAVVMNSENTSINSNYSEKVIDMNVYEYKNKFSKSDGSYSDDHRNFHTLSSYCKPLFLPNPLIININSDCSGRPNKRLIHRFIIKPKPQKCSCNCGILPYQETKFSSHIPQHVPPFHCM